MSKYLIVFVLVIGLWATGGRRVESLTSVEAEEYYKQQAEIAKEQELIAKAKKLEGKYTGQCLTSVRQFLGLSYDQLHGYAGNVVVNSKEPAIGAVVKTPGHIAAVIDIEGDKILVYESNYNWKGISRINWMEKDDKKILGYVIYN